MTAASSALSRQRGEGRSSVENATLLSVPLGRLGFWSAALALVFTVLWTVAAVVTVVASPPASWAGIDAYAASFDSRQMLMLVPVLLLAPTFVVVMACIYAYASEDSKPWALLGLVFAAMYATIASVTYVLQLTVVRQHVLSRQTAGLDLLVSVNPGSAAWALETFGYFFMSMALVVAAPVFGGGRRERWIRRLFLANGLGLPAAMDYVYTMDALHPLALAYLAVWCITFPIAMVLLAALFRRADTEEAV
jgi:hypothetical protein